MRSIDLGRLEGEANDVVCAARVCRVLGQYELCTARECKVHAEQTLRPNASEWTELRLFPFSPYAAPYIELPAVA